MASTEDGSVTCSSAPSEDQGTTSYDDSKTPVIITAAASVVDVDVSDAAAADVGGVPGKDHGSVDVTTGVTAASSVATSHLRAVFLESVDVRQPEDGRKPCLHDVIVTGEQEELVVMTDIDNNCLKVLDTMQTPRQLQRLSLGGEPCGLAAMAPLLVAVSLGSGRLAQVSLQPQVRLMDLVATRQYWGLAALGPNLLAAVHLGPPACVDIITPSGSLCGSFRPRAGADESSQELTRPDFLCVTPAGDLVISSWKERVVVCVDRQGSHKWEWQYSALQWPMGVCCHSDGSVLVCDRISKVVWLVSEGGERVTRLLDHEDTHVLGVGLDQQRQQLYVTQGDRGGRLVVYGLQ